MYRIKICYLQLEWSAFKTTTNKVISQILRIILTFLKTPYCTVIGQLVSIVYQFISINIIFNKNYIIDKLGRIIKLDKLNKI